MSDPSDALSVLRVAALAHAASLEQNAEFFERYAPAMGGYASNAADQLRGEALAIRRALTDVDLARLREVIERLRVPEPPADEWRLILYEPRWHGFARWEIQHLHPLHDDSGAREVMTLESGWTRRHRKAEYVEARYA